jgi:hypothetical protein
LPKCFHFQSNMYIAIEISLNLFHKYFLIASILDSFNCFQKFFKFKNHIFQIKKLGYLKSSWQTFIGLNNKLYLLTEKMNKIYAKSSKT